MLNGLLIRWQLARAHTEPIPPLISSALCCHSSFPFIIIIFSLARCSQNENEMKIQDENDGFVHKKDFLFFSLLLYFMCFYISTAPWAGSESTANKEIQFNDSLPARNVFPWRSAAEFVHVLDFHEFFIFSFFPFYSFNFASTIDNNTAMSIEYNKAINKKGIFCSPVYQHGSPCAHCVPAPPHYDKMKIWSASGLAHSHKFRINRIWRWNEGKPVARIGKVVPVFFLEWAQWKTLSIHASINYSHEVKYCPHWVIFVFGMVHQMQPLPKLNSRSRLGKIHRR